MSNPRCFFDMTADGKAMGRIVMELHADVYNFEIIIFFVSIKFIKI